MERLLVRKDKDPNTDFGVGFGYRIDVFFVEDWGFLNRFIPVRLREERVSVSGGGMNLAQARERLGILEGEWSGILSDREGFHEARIVREIQTDPHISRFG